MKLELNYEIITWSCYSTVWFKNNIGLFLIFSGYIYNDILLSGMIVSNTEQLSTDENGEQFRWVSEKYFLFVILSEN